MIRDRIMKKFEKYVGADRIKQLRELREKNRERIRNKGGY